MLPLSGKAAACRKGERWKPSPPFCPVNPLFPKSPPSLVLKGTLSSHPAKRRSPNPPPSRRDLFPPTPKFILGTQIEEGKGGGGITSVRRGIEKGVQLHPTIWKQRRYGWSLERAKSGDADQAPVESPGGGGWTIRPTNSSSEHPNQVYPVPFWHLPSPSRQPFFKAHPCPQFSPCSTCNGRSPAAPAAKNGGGNSSSSNRGRQKPSSARSRLRHRPMPVAAPAHSPGSRHFHGRCTIPNQRPLQTNTGKAPPRKPTNLKTYAKWILGPISLSQSRKRTRLNSKRGA